MREGWRDFHDGSEHGMLTWISKRVTKGGGGNPTVEAVWLLFEKTSSDPDWSPGKLYGSPSGRPSALSEQKKAVIAAAYVQAWVSVSGLACIKYIKGTPTRHFRAPMP